MARRMALFTVIICFLMGIPCSAKNAPALAEENTQLRQRVENLEKQVEDLQTVVGSGGQAGAPAAPGEGKNPFWSTLDVQFYGYIKGDAAYDTSRSTTGNYMVWVNSEATNDDDDEFNLTANETRLGVRIGGPKTPELETSGVVEFDFYGSGADENKAKIQMRHAYLQLFWPECRLGLLAGQTWDVVSPLVPTTLNYTVLWDAGNIGYRRPQIRLTKDFQLREDTTLQMAGAIARTIGDTVAVSGVTSESGEDAGFPTLQGRIGLVFPWLSAGRTQTGLSGHWGNEEYDVATTGSHKDFQTWSLNLDLMQPIAKWLVFKGELFTGENLDTYFGGIGQGVRAIRNAGGTTISHAEEIAAKGGWFAFTLGPWDPWSFNVGAGIDDVDAGDVNAGDRTLNHAVFGNVLYALNKHANVGFELSHWRTDYRGPGDADDLRLQTSLIYKF